MRLLAFGSLLTIASVFSCSSNDQPAAPSGTAATSASVAGTSGTASGGPGNGGAGGAVAGSAGSESVAGTAGVAGTTGGSGSEGGGASAGGMDAGPPFGHPDAAVTHPQYPGFTLWVVEDFSQALDLEKDPIWTYSDGGFQTHRFTKESISFASGTMRLTMTDAVAPSSCSYAGQGVVPQQQRTTGELRSKHNWFRYGRYEARVQAPSVKPGDAMTNGNYIVSLFTYRQPGCQEWREIDLEVLGDTPNRLSTNLITADNDCEWSPDKEQPKTFDLPGNFRTDFQTIGFEWLPDSIKFYYLGADGKPVQVQEITGSKVPKLSAKLMANLWEFGAPWSFGGPMGDNNELPFVAEYDFIRFYKWDMDADYPCPDMTAGCLKPEDVDLTANNACDGIGVHGDLAACKQCGNNVRMVCDQACQ